MKSTPFRASLITFSVFVVLWNYADSEYIWPSKLYDQQHWVLVASVVSALWLPLIQFSVVRERGDVVKLSLPVAFVEPAVSMLMIVSMTVPEETDDETRSMYRLYVKIMLGCEMIVRAFLIGLLVRVLCDFGKGLREWKGPSALAAGIFAFMSREERAACDSMCRVCRASHARWVVAIRSARSANSEWLDAALVMEGLLAP